ncbi:hypothetical protein FDP41_010083 [Naegleria fowleri]|uniref:Uncharacterized protein n=1 Tax=Naegleria fowleri TaxID=5763 RepID=A0A6A5BCQ5_NAEFO|nr:uncharacterized protein FDP41_010083 [Naegleria fowleri]KAF0971860.1 hypothetical protein FDP41_010083 [Naegleria fowleri]
MNPSLPRSTPSTPPLRTKIKQPKRLRQEINTHEFKQFYFELNLHAGDGGGDGGVGDQVEVLRFHSPSSLSTNFTTPSNLSNSKLFQRYQQTFRASDLSIEVPKKTKKRKPSTVESNQSSSTLSSTATIHPPPPPPPPAPSIAFHATKQQSQPDSSPSSQMITTVPSKNRKEDQENQVEPPTMHFKSNTPQQQQTIQTFTPFQMMNEWSYSPSIHRHELPYLQVAPQWFNEMKQMQQQWQQQMQPMQQNPHDGEGFFQEQNMCVVSPQNNLQNVPLSLQAGMYYGNLFGYESLQNSTSSPNKLHDICPTSSDMTCARSDNNHSFQSGLSTFGQSPNKEEVTSFALLEALQRWLNANLAERSHVQQVVVPSYDSCDPFRNQQFDPNPFVLSCDPPHGHLEKQHIPLVPPQNKGHVAFERSVESSTENEHSSLQWACLYLALQQAFSNGGAPFSFF